MDTRRHLLLLVEDHEGTRNVLRTIFTRRGWNVLTASTVAEGLAVLDRRPEPDWVVLDLMLPDGDGEAVLRKVREDNLNTRVAVTTATYDPERLTALASLHPEALFQKPIDLDRLCQACER